MQNGARVYHFYDKVSVVCDRSANVLGGCDTTRNSEYY